MFVRVLTVDTAAGPYLIRPDFIHAKFRKNIEPCHDLTIRSATNHSQAITQMIKLFVRIGDLCVPYYFGLAPDFPPGILVVTAFINDNNQSISPVNRNITPRSSRTVPIISRSSQNVSSIHTAKPQRRFLDDIDNVHIQVSTQVTIPSRYQKLLLVSSQAPDFYHFFPMSQHSPHENVK